MKVVDELKTQMQNIQYYSLLQKLFISYIFKHLEGQIDSVNKNSNINNFTNMFKNNQQNKFNPQSANNQFPFFPPQEMDFMSAMNSQNNQDKDPINFMKQMQNSGFNFANLMGASNMPNSSNLPGMPAGHQMPNLDPNILSQMSQNNNNNNQFNNPMELLKNLHSSINCQINQNQTGSNAAGPITGFNSKQVNPAQQAKIPQMSQSYPGIAGIAVNPMNMRDPGFNPNNPNVISNSKHNLTTPNIAQSANNTNLNNNQQAQPHINNNSSGNNNINNNNQNLSSQNLPSNNNSNQNQILNNQNQVQTNQSLYNNLQSLADSSNAQQLKNQNQYNSVSQSTPNTSFAGNNQANNAFANQTAFNPSNANALFNNQNQMNIPSSLNATSNNQVLNQLGINNPQNQSVNVNSNNPSQQATFNNPNSIGSNVKSGNQNINHNANISQQHISTMFHMFQNQQSQQYPDYQK